MADVSRYPTTYSTWSDLSTPRRVTTFTSASDLLTETKINNSGSSSPSTLHFPSSPHSSPSISYCDVKFSHLNLPSTSSTHTPKSPRSLVETSENESSWYETVEEKLKHVGLHLCRQSCIVSRSDALVDKIVDFRNLIEQVENNKIALVILNMNWEKWVTRVIDFYFQWRKKPLECFDPLEQRLSELENSNWQRQQLILFWHEQERRWEVYQIEQNDQIFYPILVNISKSMFTKDFGSILSITREEGMKRIKKYFKKNAWLE